MGEDEGCVVRLRGLPWSATEEDIQKFFEEVSIAGGLQGIHLTYTREGRPTGECYVELSGEEDVEKALKKTNQHIGPRYIEVFRSKKSEMEWMIKRSGPVGVSNPADEAVVRLRGLPFGCSKEEIAQFFSGLEIVPNGITLPTDFRGRSTGEAYVQFVSKEVTDKALSKHKEKIGHRYIEIFRSSILEIRDAINAGRGGGTMSGGGMGGGMGGGGGPGGRSFGGRPGPYDRVDRYGGGGGGGGGGASGGRYGGGFRKKVGGDQWGSSGSGPRYNDSYGRAPRPSRNMYADSGSGHRIHMRGLPFRASEQDIADFFHPLQPLAIHINYEQGRASGEADVEFVSHEEAVRAMSRDKCNMQHRYIELFLNSTGGSGGYGGGYGGGYNS